MNGSDLFEAMGNIDEKYIQEMEQQPKVVRFQPFMYAKIAAIFILFLGAAIFLYDQQLLRNVDELTIDSQSEMSPMSVRVVEEDVESSVPITMNNSIKITYQSKIYEMVEVIQAQELGVNYTDEFTVLGDIVNNNNANVIIDSEQILNGTIFYDEIADALIIYCINGEYEANYILVK